MWRNKVWRAQMCRSTLDRESRRATRTVRLCRPQSRLWCVPSKDHSKRHRRPAAKPTQRNRVPVAIICMETKNVLMNERTEKRQQVRAASTSSVNIKFPESDLKYEWFGRHDTRPPKHELSCSRNCTVRESELRVRVAPGDVNTELAILIRCVSGIMFANKNNFNVISLTAISKAIISSTCWTSPWTLFLDEQTNTLSNAAHKHRAGSYVRITVIIGSEATKHGADFNSETLSMYFECKNLFPWQYRPSK